MKDYQCVCEGNWRRIIHESEGLIGRKYKNKDGETFIFVGVMHGEDDYYYCMWKDNDMRLLSCVGSIEDHGFDLFDERKMIVPAIPEPKCIESMCLRYDHSHLMKKPSINDSLLDEWREETDEEFNNRQEATRRIMRQLYEEATGQGFFRRR